jgi:hypothetical protein
MNEADNTSVLRAAEKFAEDTAKNMPYKAFVSDVFRNGARLSYNILTQWHEAFESLPELGKKVLCKLPDGEYHLGCYRADNSWRLDGIFGVFQNEDIRWREIHEH